MAHLLLLFALPLLSFAHDAGLPHLPPPDATGFDYRALLAQEPAPAGFDTLTDLLAVGERNLLWLEHMNSKRAPEDKISFSTPGGSKGVPIDRPKIYNPALILEQYAKVKAALPPAIAEVIYGSGPFPDDPPVPLAEYQTHAWRLDVNYQLAARWRTLYRYIPRLAKKKAQDIRGYYFLSRLGQREQKLRNPRQLDEAERIRVREWLVQMCFNDFWSSLSYCRRTVEAAVNAGSDLNPLYAKWEKKSAAVYASYFTIENPRSEFRWQADGFLAPFTDPRDETVRRFLQENLEDEWRLGEWQLRMQFTTKPGHAYVIFQPDVMPNVNGYGGDRITMNSKQPLTEYDAQRTIRHEFGHVLGFPDCYVEFFDEELQAMVNYQIDLDNLMCGRVGHLLPEHLVELRRAYNR